MIQAFNQDDLSLIQAASEQIGGYFNDMASYTPLEELVLATESLPLMLSVMDKTCHLIYVNSVFIQKIGISIEDIGGIKWMDKIHPEDRALVVGKVKEAVAAGKPFQTEQRVLDGDGRYRPYASLSFPLVLQDGGLYYLGICHDISVEVQQREARLKELTRREIEVLKLLPYGYTNQQIADNLFISEVTVKNHVARILKKLGLKNRSQGASFAKDIWNTKTS